MVLSKKKVMKNKKSKSHGKIFLLTIGGKPIISSSAIKVKSKIMKNFKKLMQHRTNKD